MITNKKARYQYEVVERLEAGIVLKGSEVKSIRDGRISFVDSFAQIRRGESFLHNLHIALYPFDHNPNYQPTRERKLLLHKKEIEKLTGALARKGLTLIPLSIYFKKGRAKVEMGLAKGKRLYDKRRKLKDRAVDQEIKRVLKENSR